MVCKEEVLSWFKDLDSYKRIDVLYELLNMCLPFELRFLGSCVEEIGKHTYQDLRGPTITANDLEKLSKDVTFNPGLLEESVRHRVLIYLSLLSSRNYSVANWLYKKLLRTDHIEDFVMRDMVKDELLHSEFLLLFTMALHHPAFTFDQKQDFSRILTRLIDFREIRNRDCPKPTVYGYPPGFGYPPKMNGPDGPTVPVKTAPTVSFSDTTLHQQPPGLHMQPPPIDIMTFWSRPGFPCGAPEVAPFPAPAISPLVSQAGSPIHSRSNSPHRTPLLGRLPPPPLMHPHQPPISHVEVMPPITQLMDPLSHSSLPVYNAEMKLPDEELSSIPEEKQLRDLPWPGPPPMINPPDIKPNGMRFPPFPGKIRPFLAEQMQQMHLDGENSLHLSNSSSNSSPNQTPPGTPACTTPAVTPHGPGRGNNNDKSRMNGNGMPPFGHTGLPQMCDAQSPPPPPYNNCSVPYSYPQSYTQGPPNRSMLHYNHTYRPTFSQYPTFQTENSFPNYPVPYIIYSSLYPPRLTPAGCHNCGAQGHLGQDCTAQNIEEITQKKTYQLDFAAAIPEPEK